MNRLTNQGFVFLRKLSKRSTTSFTQTFGSQIQLQHLFSSAKVRAEFTQKLLSGKFYQILGYPQGTDVSSLSDSQIKRQYLAMVKKYHSDSVIDPSEKLQNQQITKCIISAFDKISSNRVQQQIDKGIYDKIYKDEDQIAMKIYGKKFNEIKYDLFKEGNNAKRVEFMEELQKIKKQSKDYSYGHARAQTVNNNSGQSVRHQPLNIRVSEDFASDMTKFLIPIVGIIGAIMYYYINKQKQEQSIAKAQKNKSRLTLTDQKIRQIQKRSTQLHDKKLSDLINSYVDQQPPSLKFPSKQDPDQIEQLVQFTIATDINLYEVDSKLMSVKSNLEKLKQLKNENQVKEAFGQKYNPFQLKRIKVNSFLTLSLEAERCLQNIYVKVKDVAQQIQETGKYTPPKIFFRFYGYCMFEIRQKPLSLQNYRDTQYISLFDLFFDYYSPIPLKRHEYNEYVVGINDDDQKMYGQVHLNHRKLNQKYISRNDKIVVMKDQIREAREQQKYEQIWEDFYRKYSKIWLRGHAERISTEHSNQV